MLILFLLCLETGGQGGHVGEALYINGFRRPLTKNTMWAQVGRWAQNGTCPLGSAHLPTLGKCRWARFFARIPLNSKASPTCPLRPPDLSRLLKQFKSEVVKGYSERRAARVLSEAGWLERGPQGRMKTRRTLPGIGRQACYALTIPEDEEPTD